jgi:ABC-type multidrug transport system fused ATPase/permease subunit
MIAHRLCTVKRADEILILDNGSVLEYGSREVLSKDLNSHFHQLLQTGLEEVLV